MNRFFERITTDEEFAKYNITVHSRPKRPEDDDSVVDGPWLVTLEDFISVSFLGISSTLHSLLRHSFLTDYSTCGFIARRS